MTADQRRDGLADLTRLDEEMRAPAEEDAIDALNRVMQQAPCGHENLDNSIGDGKTWARCDDCGVTVEQALVHDSRESASRFDDDIATIRAALASKPQPKGTPCDRCDTPMSCREHEPGKFCPTSEAQAPAPGAKPLAWLFEARHIDSAWMTGVSLQHPGAEGVYLRNVTPLYASQPPAVKDRKS